ncbi:MAG TPA: GNAT family N-acetyltransferase [Chthoniobacterales bacterium]
MKLTNWLKFIWDLRTFEAPETSLPSQYVIRRAVRSEEEAVRKAIFSAFSLDSDWSDSLNRIWPTLNEQIGDTFNAKEPKCLVLTHGTRVIGASILSLDSDAANQVVSGPCILVEYRNRGLGTQLLAASLAFLRESGLETASGITKKSIPAAKFVYHKFGGRSEPCENEPELVAP